MFLASCSNNSKLPVLNPGNIPSWTFTVDPNTDTIIKTPKGASIKITKGTFGEKTILEVKEAYTMQDMLLGGLITESNGQPLSSGGMIYINSENNLPVTLLKPITLSLPTSYVDSVMKIYKSNDDSINWQLVDTIPNNSISEGLNNGKQIFKSKCGSCHALDRILTGPALRGFTQRGSWNNRNEVARYIKNPAAYMVGDRYTQFLQKKYGSIMPGFNLSFQDVNDVIDYIQNEENNPYDDISWKMNDTATMTDLLNSNSICSDTIYFNSMDTALANENTQSLSIDSLDLENYDTLPSPVTSELEAASRNGFTVRPGDMGYVFEIKTLGWYNIDAAVLGLDGTLLCDLQVHVSPNDIPDMNVYVLFPKHKNLSAGVLNTEGIYEFNKIDGKIPLFIGERGLVIAFGSLGEDLYVGSNTFIANLHQKINVNVSKTSKEDFLELIKQNKIEGIDLDIQKQEMKIEKRPCYSDNSTSDNTRIF